MATDTLPDVSVIAMQWYRTRPRAVARFLRLVSSDLYDKYREFALHTATTLNEDVALHLVL